VVVVAKSSGRSWTVSTHPRVGENGLIFFSKKEGADLFGIGACDVGPGNTATGSLPRPGRASITCPTKPRGPRPLSWPQEPGVSEPERYPGRIDRLKHADQICQVWG